VFSFGGSRYTEGTLKKTDIRKKGLSGVSGDVAIVAREVMYTGVLVDGVLPSTLWTISSVVFRSA